MATIAQSSRVPDVVLRKVGGAEINPSALIGQEFVLFFCPANSAAAAREIEAYRSLAGEFQDHGVWLLGVLADGIEPPPHEVGKPSIALTHDPSGAAWCAFAPWLNDPKAQKALGATFLFTRSGCFDQAWAGAGHAKDVLEEARRRN